MQIYICTYSVQIVFIT